MNKKIKVLIIGYGSIGKRHADILLALDQIEEIHIVSKHSESDFVTFKTLEEIDNLNYYDYFVISSITSLHISQLRIIDEKVSDKIILVEKPLAISCEELSVRNSVYVAYNLRFHPLMTKLYELLTEEKVLNINIQTGQYLPSWRPDRDYRKSYSASKDEGGGVLLDLSHEIDYLMWLFGDIQTIKSINSKISDLEISSDDFVTSIGELSSGAIFNFTMDYISKVFMRRVVVNTIEKTFVADFMLNNLVVSDKSCSNQEYIIPSADRNLSYREMHKHVLGLVTKNNAATIADGLKVLSIIEDIRNNKI